MGLSMDDLREALERVKQSASLRTPSGYRITPARDLTTSMFREVGLLSDEEVANLAYSGIWLAANRQPMHPKQACAIRVAFARSGAEGPEMIYNTGMNQWVSRYVQMTHED